MKLEYGKRYITRNGQLAGPLEKSCLVDFPFTGCVTTWDGKFTWNSSGSQGANGNESPIDIVSEYCESVCEEPAPELRKLVWVPGRTYKMRNGGLVFVTEVGELGSYPIVGFRIYPGEDAEQFPNTWTIEGKRHMGNVESSFDIVDYAYEVGDDE